MALTANPQSALSNGLEWDNMIVPALRKRLESESRVLSNRMSRASMEEELPPLSAQPQQPATGVSSRGPRSAISHTGHQPQQSYYSTRSTVDSLARSTAESVNSTNGYPRTRTKSQPFINDPSSRSLGNPIASRSASPAAASVLGRPSADIKPSRIPTAARRRTASTSTQGHPVNGMPRSESRNGSQTALRDVTPTPETELWPVQEVRQPVTPPYLTPTRPSIDEERPFEHWYRGETSRNGGVGEMRVGRREEMLDIANYGHALQNPKLRSIVTSVAPFPGTRRRADSLGARESFYLDDASAGRVLDEEPLTDLDNELDVDTDSDSAEGQSIPMEDESIGPVERQRIAPPTRIPPPQISPRHVLDEYPSPMPRSGSEPPPSSAPATQPSFAASTSTKAAGQTPSPTEKRGRTKSPAKANKKAKVDPSRLTAQKRSKSQGDILRGSIAMYPSSEGLSEDAIPTWTQPKLQNGNWDEVILPTVARKKGLSNHYEQADGSPQPQRVQEARVEPAPGTFGYDHNKARFRPVQESSIEMAEFGQSPPPPPQVQPEPEFQVEEAPLKTSSGLEPQADQSRRRPISAMEPAPFSRYGPPPQNDGVPRSTKDRPPEIIITQPTFERQHAELAEVSKDDDDDARCCKCVVM